jgi:hypothetical protein
MTRGLKVAGLIALSLIAIFVVRDASVRWSVDKHPDLAATIWRGHPAATISNGMAEIAKAASARRQVGQTVTIPIIESSRTSPLSPEPFMVQGIRREEGGDELAAGRLFLAAEQRNPREIAPHYFLANYYAKRGQAALGLTELGKVIRLVPGSAGQLAPRIAAAARQAGGPAMIRSLISENPELRDDLMRAMATDANNLSFVSSLANPGASTDWQPVMVQSLLTAGLFEKALDLWRRSNGVPDIPNGNSLLIDPGFSLSVPPPFGWTLASGPSGVAESAEGGLHVVSYGRDAFVVASQTMLLPPGTYTLTQHILAASGGVPIINWRISCLHSAQQVASIVLSAGTNGASGKFQILAGCAAQRIELMSNATDEPQTSDLTLGPIALSRSA